MTDEERQEACEALRNGNAHYWKQEWYNELADELERLAADVELRKAGKSKAVPVKVGDRTVWMKPLAQSDAEPSRDAILRRCERWLRHEVEATFQEESGYDLWEAIKAGLAQSDAEPHGIKKTRAILQEMRDITFGVSGKDAQQVEDYFTGRAIDALAALAQSDERLELRVSELERKQAW